jgi:hypothetical protein
MSEEQRDWEVFGLVLRQKTFGATSFAYKI